MTREWVPLIGIHGHECRLVDGYSNSVVEELRGCDSFLWHVNQDYPNDLRFARSVLLAAGKLGLQVYPDHHTAWHFDDKVAQKYLLEAIGAPLAQTWVFFEYDEAIDFIMQAEYPLVFKLRGGAGSANVRLLHSRADAERVVSRMFGKGVAPFPVAGAASDALHRARRKDRGFRWLLRNSGRVARVFYEKRRRHERERGYVLFQRYIQGNDHDVRVMIVGDRAFSSIRHVRPGDFRASGSGRSTFTDVGDTDTRLVDLGFRVARDIMAQTLALDFVYEPDTGEPVLLEVSFVMPPEPFSLHKGYFDEDLNWHPGCFSLAELVLLDVINGRV